MRRVLLLALVAACGLPEPTARVRVLAAAPSGEGIDPTAVATIDFSGEVDPAGLLDGRRVLLVRAETLKDALAAVESEAGADPGVAQIACAASLEAGGTRLVLRPNAPLASGAGFALVLSSRSRAPDGREVLDADGRLRPTVVHFVTLEPPPPAVFLTEILADAATPEAGGEYVEVLNLGPGPLDLAGWRFEKRSTTGTWSGCTVGEGWIGPVPEGSVALVVGGSWDSRYGLPPEVPLFPCGATSLAGGIANDRPPVVRLLDRSRGLAAILDASSVAACPGALEASPPAKDIPEGACCTCTPGTPGSLP